MAIAFAGDATLFRIENFRVEIGGTDVGFTEGGVEVSINSAQVVLKGDQYGITPLNTKNNGDEVHVAFTLKETTLANLNRVLSAGTLRSVGGSAVGVGGNLSASIDGLTRAVAILLHPLDTDDATLTKDINIWKGLPTGDIKIKYGPDKEAMFAVSFLCLPDTTKTAGKQIIDFGLTAAT